MTIIIMQGPKGVPAGACVVSEVGISTHQSSGQLLKGVTPLRNRKKTHREKIKVAYNPAPLNWSAPQYCSHRERPQWSCKWEHHRSYCRLLCQSGSIPRQDPCKCAGDTGYMSISKKFHEAHTLLLRTKAF